ADETLALFAAGDIDPRTRETVLAHIEGCRDCLGAVLAAAAQFHEEQAATTQPRWWIGAVAAAAILAVVTIPIVRYEQPSMSRLVALAPKSERTTELRLSGGFAWAPYRAPVRSANAPVDVARLKLGGGAGDVIERAAGEHDAEAQHAAAVAMVLVDKPDEAAARLQQNAHDAATWNDLAVARYETAIRSRSSLAPALAAADQALRINAQLPEALFNRAVVLERMGSTADAQRAWQ